MTAGRLRLILDLLVWSQRDLAARLGVSHSLVNRWAMGGAAVPGPVADWLERVLAAVTEAMEANPAPRAPHRDGWGESA